MTTETSGNIGPAYLTARDTFVNNIKGKLKNKTVTLLLNQAKKVFNFDQKTTPEDIAGALFHAINLPDHTGKRSSADMDKLTSIYHDLEAATKTTDVAATIIGGKTRLQSFKDNLKKLGNWLLSRPGKIYHSIANQLHKLIEIKEEKQITAALKIIQEEMEKPNVNSNDPDYKKTLESVTELASGLKKDFKGWEDLSSTVEQDKAYGETPPSSPPSRPTTEPPQIKKKKLTEEEEASAKRELEKFNKNINKALEDLKTGK